MPGMPYFMEKGPNLSVLESFLNDESRKRQALQDLRDGRPLGAIGFLASKSLDAGPPEYNTYPKRLKHFNEDWLGQAAIPEDPQQTGYWRHWRGDPEAILRETFIRAIEVSLGIDHGAPSDTQTRNWPIVVFWKCSIPWFETWVTWHRSNAEQGQVTVMLVTPPITKGHAIFTSPIPPPTHPHKDFVEDPQTANSAEGMWVVTHRTQTSEWAGGTSTDPGPPGDWWNPFRRWVGNGDIVVVSPSEFDGGVLPDGRKYEQP